MKKKEDTPNRIIKRRYEDKHKAERKATNGTFSTYLPRSELEEINAFLKEHEITKVELIRQGYNSLKRQIEQGQKE